MRCRPAATSGSRSRPRSRGAPHNSTGTRSRSPGPPSARSTRSTGRSLRQRLSLVAYTFIVYAVCAVALGSLAVGTGTSLSGYERREWALFVAMALVPGLAGHTVINWALKYVRSTVVSVSLLGEPVASTFLALVLLDEVPGVVTVLGAVVVLGGIAITNRARSA